MKIIRIQSQEARRFGVIVIRLLHGFENQLLLGFRDHFMIVAQGSLRAGGSLKQQLGQIFRPNPLATTSVPPSICSWTRGQT